jgi:hypothetical protein
LNGQAVTSSLSAFPNTAELIRRKASLSSAPPTLAG